MVTMPPPTLSIQDLSVLSLEELMDVSVVTSSKKQKRQFDESSSIFVITQKDISRSGVTSLPEALRLAPGVHVHVSMPINGQLAYTALMNDFLISCWC